MNVTECTEYNEWQNKKQYRTLSGMFVFMCQTMKLQQIKRENEEDWIFAVNHCRTHTHTH